jgi:hypothetical protein
MNDLITLLLEIALVLSAAGLGFGLYVWYLDLLWHKELKRIKSKGSYRPVEGFEDIEYREVARYD